MIKRRIEQWKTVGGKLKKEEHLGSLEAVSD